MTPLTPEENESRVLAFRRERLADGVQVAKVALRRGENSMFHHHTRTRDTFYVLNGELTISLRLDAAAARAMLRGTRVEQTEGVLDDAGRPLTRVTLRSGDVYVVEPGVVHCAANLRDTPCEFLCIEGVGEYDFVPEQGA
jgi:mannose-6-phosphate isomerase-like protein (cupin superfamily)